MKNLSVYILCVLAGFSGVMLSQSQPASSLTAQSSVVPNLVRFSGTDSDRSNKQISGVVGITFALYKDQQGGSPLWLETQNVATDKNGHYSVSLGATKAQGVPAELFTTGEAKWLGVQVEGQAEQPRVLLLSVPYALKAADAETIGGLPPSAFVLATPGIGGTKVAESATASTSTAPSPNTAVTGQGTGNFLPLWDTASDIVNSAVFQSGTGTTAKIGINTATPVATLDVKGSSTIRGVLALPATAPATAVAGKSSQPLSFAASSFSSGTGTAVNQTFRWLAEPAGNNSATPSGTLNLLFGSGANPPAETGLKIGSNGHLTFATGQTFPGTGTITGVTAGTGLTGGGATGNVTLSLNTTTTDARYAQLGAVNAFTKNNSFAGTVGVGTSAPSAQLDVEAPATAPTGILGVTSSTTFFAAAVLGHATGASGVTRGVYGASDSPSGIGVHGIGATGGQFETGNGNIFIGRGQGQNRVSIDSLGNTFTSGALTASGAVSSGGAMNAGGGLFTSVSGGTTAVFASSDTGTGVFGSGGIGVLGDSTNGDGVHGINGSGASGVAGINNGGGQGLYGAAMGTSGQGVHGESFASGGANGYGPDGVDGITHSAAGSGVAGVNDAFGGIAVYGVSTNGGFGFATPSNVQQGRTMGGWAKALIFVDPFTQNGTAITRCYNSQAGGATVWTPPCGFDISHQFLGFDIIDLHFQVNDRFISVSSGALVTTCVRDPNTCPGNSVSQLSVATANFDGSGTDTAFWVIVF